MAWEKVKELLQAIEAKACETVNNLTEARAALAQIKTDATAAIAEGPPQDVADILQAIKVTACETYDTLTAAQMALASIKLNAAIAISLLGK